MAKKHIHLLPKAKAALQELGENIKLARLRRNLTAAMLAERAGITLPTLRSIERGDPSSSMGAYASVLHCLGLHEDLRSVASDDALGRKLQDSGLLIKRRAVKR